MQIRIFSSRFFRIMIIIQRDSQTTLYLVIRKVLPFAALPERSVGRKNPQGAFARMMMNRYDARAHLLRIYRHDFMPTEQVDDRAFPAACRASRGNADRRVVKPVNQMIVSGAIRGI